MKEFEIRDFRKIEIETREQDQNGKKERHIKGVIPYNKNSEDLGGFVEVIKKGAFTKTIQESNIRCLWSHDTKYCLGTTKSGTLVLEDRNDGLYFDCSVPNTGWANDLFESLERRDVPGVSFGFNVIKDNWISNGSEKPALRELNEVRCFEISVGVAFPAYPDSNSECSMRALFLKRDIDIEKLTAILTRLDGKEKIENEEDVETIKTLIVQLNDMLPKEETENQESENSTTENEPETKSENSTLTRSRQIQILMEENKTL